MLADTQKKVQDKAVNETLCEMQYEALVEMLASTLVKTMAKTLLYTLADPLPKLQAKKIGETLTYKVVEVKN